MNNRLLAHVGILVTALVIGGSALVSHAHPKLDEPPPANAAAPLTIGSIAMVDIEKVYNASGDTDQLQQKANEIATDAEQRLKNISAVPYLNQAELQEYLTLVNKIAPNEQEQARFKALHDLSDQRQQELNALQVKPDAQLTEMDKARMRQLQEASRLLEQVLPSLQEQLRQQQLARVDAYRRDQMSKLRGVVAQVARDKGYTQVFEASTLVYSVNDLTSAVIQKVGKRPNK